MACWRGTANVAYAFICVCLVPCCRAAPFLRRRRVLSQHLRLCVKHTRASRNLRRERTHARSHARMHASQGRRRRRKRNAWPPCPSTIRLWCWAPTARRPATWRPCCAGCAAPRATGCSSSNLARAASAASSRATAMPAPPGWAAWRRVASRVVEEGGAQAGRAWGRVRVRLEGRGAVSAGMRLVEVQLAGLARCVCCVACCGTGAYVLTPAPACARAYPLAHACAPLEGIGVESLGGAEARPCLRPGLAAPWGGWCLLHVQGSAVCGLRVQDWGVWGPRWGALGCLGVKIEWDRVGRGAGARWDV